MQLVKTIQQVRQKVSDARKMGKTIGFVPTMGALHTGHASLIEAAAKKTDFVVVSIFVNPTQFGPNEDFDSYPRTIDADSSLCEAAGADLIFAPEVNEMYPSKLLSWVIVDDITNYLCGLSRPEHFKGVATVCMKLFNVVMADFAFFGQKDAQQVVVIKRMVKDLNMPLEIISCPTIRESDGLAISSRNKYLSPKEREIATCLYKSLCRCRDMIASGIKDSQQIIKEMKEILEISPIVSLDYISLVDTESLEDLQIVTSEVLVAVAARVGSARLIDNMIIKANN